LAQITVGYAAVDLWPAATGEDEEGLSKYLGEDANRWSNNGEDEELSQILFWWVK